MRVKSKMVLLVTAVIALSWHPIAKAQDGNWGAWRSTGVGISIRFSRVNNKTLTWSFRNDTNRVLESMDFDYSFVDADTNTQTTQHDLLPYPLRPGSAVGGWTAFMANTRGPVSIAIKDYHFRD